MSIMSPCCFVGLDALSLSFNFKKLKGLKNFNNAPH